MKEVDDGFSLYGLSMGEDFSSERINGLELFKDFHSSAIVLTHIHHGRPGAIKARSVYGITKDIEDKVCVFFN